MVKVEASVDFITICEEVEADDVSDRNNEESIHNIKNILQTLE